MHDLLADYDYTLPPGLIADHPTPERSGARMLVVDRSTGRLLHRQVSDLPTFMEPGDLAVLNNSKVIRARTRSTDGKIEVFFVEPRPDGCWLCLVRPGRKLKVGDQCQIGDSTITVEQVLPGGERLVRCEPEVDLERWGSMPLPPYIRREPGPEDEERYQCVFAREPGSVAAPTAGLHFTPEMLGRIPHSFVTLHVGLGTFQPVKVPRLEDHQMHEERFQISDATADCLNQAGRILAVGTTSVRVLESLPPGPVIPGNGSTSLFIRPPYHFLRTSRLLTNFHLPCSTLLVLVSAFAGYDLIREAYAEAIKERYRFFSYGDCMLIL